MLADLSHSVALVPALGQLCPRAGTRATEWGYVGKPKKEVISDISARQTRKIQHAECTMC